MTYTAKRPFSANTNEVIGLVTFTNATYRGKPVTGEFDLVKGFQAGGNGPGFVTVRETSGKKTRFTVPGENVGYQVREVGAEESVEASRLLTYKEAADVLGISVDAVRKRVARNTLNGEVVDGVKYVTL